MQMWDVNVRGHPESPGEYQHRCDLSVGAQMTTSFGPRVLVDFVNRWYVLQQPAGRATVKGILQSQLYSLLKKIMHIQNQEHIGTGL